MTLTGWEKPLARAVKIMPHWSIEEEHNLIDMVEEGRSIKDMCKILYRSPEARKLKMRRLGLEPSVSREKASDKVTSEAATEYAKAKDILHVKELLGHRNSSNPLIYAQLINFESDEYYSAHTAKTVEEARQLMEVGFEYVCRIENCKLFRKRK